MDEQLKLIPSDPEKQEASAHQLKMVYHELASTGQLVPRHIFVDFAQSYGNCSSCFGNGVTLDKELIGDDTWDQAKEDFTGYNTQVSLSKFQ